MARYSLRHVLSELQAKPSVLSGSGAPADSTDISVQRAPNGKALYAQIDATPNKLWFKQESGDWTEVGDGAGGGGMTLLPWVMTPSEQPLTLQQLGDNEEYAVDLDGNTMSKVVPDGEQKDGFACFEGAIKAGKRWVVVNPDLSGLPLQAGSMTQVVIGRSLADFISGTGDRCSVVAGDDGLLVAFVPAAGAPTEATIDADHTGAFLLGFDFLANTLSVVTATTSAIDVCPLPSDFGLVAFGFAGMNKDGELPVTVTIDVSVDAAQTYGITVPAGFTQLTGGSLECPLPAGAAAGALYEVTQAGQYSGDKFAVGDLALIHLDGTTATHIPVTNSIMDWSIVRTPSPVAIGASVNASIDDADISDVRMSVVSFETPKAYFETTPAVSAGAGVQWLEMVASNSQAINEIVTAFTNANAVLGDVIDSMQNWGLQGSCTSLMLIKMAPGNAGKLTTVSFTPDDCSENDAYLNENLLEGHAIYIGLNTETGTVVVEPGFNDSFDVEYDHEGPATVGASALVEGFKIVAFMEGISPIDYQYPETPLGPYDLTMRLGFDVNAEGKLPLRAAGAIVPPEGVADGRRYKVIGSGNYLGTALSNGDVVEFMDGMTKLLKHGGGGGSGNWMGDWAPVSSPSPVTYSGAFGGTAPTITGDVFSHTTTTNGDSIAAAFSDATLPVGGTVWIAAIPDMSELGTGEATAIIVIGPDVTTILSGSEGYLFQGAPGAGLGIGSLPSNSFTMIDEGYSTADSFILQLNEATGEVSVVTGNGTFSTGISCAAGWGMVAGISMSNATATTSTASVQFSTTDGVTGGIYPSNGFTPWASADGEITPPAGAVEGSMYRITNEAVISGKAVQVGDVVQFVNGTADVVVTVNDQSQFLREGSSVAELDNPEGQYGFPSRQEVDDDFYNHKTDGEAHTLASQYNAGFMSSAEKQALTSLSGVAENATWAPKLSKFYEPNSYRLNSLACCPATGRIIATRNTSYSGKYMVYSDDGGQTWATVPYFSSSTYSSDRGNVWWDAELNKFIACMGIGQSRYYESSDGLFWSSGASPSFPYGFADIESFAHSAKLNVTVGAGYRSSSVHAVAVLANDNWQQVDLTNVGGNQGVRAVAWSPKLEVFVVVPYATSGACSTSSDGVNWSTSGEVPMGYWLDIKWIDHLDMFIAVGNGYGFNATVMWSKDGSSWESNIDADLLPALKKFEWSRDLGVFVGIGPNGGAWSLDGKNWTNVINAPETVLDYSSWYGDWMCVSAVHNRVVATNSTQVFIAKDSALPSVKTAVENRNIVSVEVKGAMTLGEGAANFTKLHLTADATITLPVSTDRVITVGTSLSFTIPPDKRLTVVLANGMLQTLEVFGTKSYATLAVLSKTGTDAWQLVYTRATGSKVVVLGSVGTSTMEIDLSAGDVFTASTGTDILAISFTNPPVEGDVTKIQLRITQGPATNTVTWPASFSWVGAAPTMPSVEGKTAVLDLCTLDGGVTWEAEMVVRG